MATAREIKRRIRSVDNIGQITRAMEAVAASKMKRAQDQVLGTRAYAQKAWEVLTHLASQWEADEAMHPLLQVRPVRTMGLVLITSDRGLCGAFNHNMIRRALEYIEAAGETTVQLITVGRIGRNFMLRLGRPIVAEFSDLPASPRLIDVTPIARVAIGGFLEGQFDLVCMAYTDFITTLTQRPAIKRLLPIRPTELETQAMAEYVEDVRLTMVEYIYEPDPRTILGEVLPRFTELQVYQAVLESIASEHSARMVAMRNATESAAELVEELTLSFNKARQQAITLEIMDIAGGAEALAQARAAAR
ncbi:MAG: ATP synthase F1 subunit gamma [Anaerolineae bacterium]